MFNADELSDEVAEMFSEAQAPYEDVVKRSAVFGFESVNASSHVDAYGARRRQAQAFRIFRPNPPKTPERKAKMRKYEADRAAADIRARLLAGERPKLGGRGRPPTRWFKIAEELGIDLWAPSAA